MENIEADKPNTLDTSQSSQESQIQMTKDTKEPRMMHDAKIGVL